MTEAVFGNSTPAPAIQAPSSAILNRRHLLTGAAAMAVAAAPVAAQAALPDQELLDLGRRYEAALAAEEAALAAWDAACDAFAAAEPATPEILRCRPTDFEMFRTLANTGVEGDFLTENEVVMIRSKPRTRLVYELVDLATGEKTIVASPRDHDGRRSHELHGRSVPYPKAQARADEIAAAWDRYAAARDALAEHLQLAVAEAGYYDAVRARRAVAGEIIAASATTLAGLAVRARIVAGMFDTDDEPDELALDDRLMISIVRDLVAIARPFDA